MATTKQPSANRPPGVPATPELPALYQEHAALAALLEHEPPSTREGWQEVALWAERLAQEWRTAARRVGGAAAAKFTDRANDCGAVVLGAYSRAAALVGQAVA